MAEVKIGVTGKVDAGRAAVQEMTDAVNQLAKSVSEANKEPFKAPGIEQATKDLAKLQKGFQDAIKQSAGLRNALKNSGQNPAAGILNVNWTKLNIDPAAAQGLRNRAFTFAARGTSWDRTNVRQPATPPGAEPVPSGDGGRPSLRNRPDGNPENGNSGEGSGGNRRNAPWRNLGSRAGRAFTGGVGGGVGQIAGEGIDGAEAGSEAAGAVGGAAGLLGGLGIGAALFGIAKVGQMGAAGYGMAKERDLGLDSIKRQLGDLGISFEQLKAMTDSASEGLGVNAAQFAELERQAVQSSHGADRSPESLASSVQTSVGFGRAYGVDPAASVGFFGSMKAIDPRQNNRELAVMIAEAIERTGGRALASDVMQVVQALSSATSRLSLSSPNVGAEGAAYGSLVRNGGPGMTPDNASALLGQANSSVMNMGGAGEAGMNFILQSLNHEGGPQLNPVAARALATGGLFGSRSSVFGKGTELSKYFGNDSSFAGLSQGAGSNTTTFDAIKKQLDSSFGGNKWLELDGAQRLFGVSSPQQAAALMNMKDGGYGGLNKALQTAGVSLNDINASGIQTLARVGSAQTMPELNSVYKDISARTGAGALSDGERKNLDSLSTSGNMKEFQSALIKAVASKDQEETEGSDLRKGVASLENIQILIGEKMVPVMNDVRNALLSLAGKDGKSATPDELERRAQEALTGNAGAGGIPGWYDSLHKTGGAATDMSMGWTNAYTGSNPTSLTDRMKSWVYRMGGEGGPPDPDKLKTLASSDRTYGLPRGLLEGVWGTESSFGHNTGSSSMGAVGNFQQMPDTIKQYGIKIGDFQSEQDGAARQLRDLIKKRDGNVNDALFDYGGVKKNIAAGNDYVDKVVGYGQMDDPRVTTEPDNPKTPSRLRASGSTSAAQGVTDTVVLDMNLNVIGTDSSGGKSIHSVSSSVAVPRGSGTHQVQIQAQ